MNEIDFKSAHDIKENEKLKWERLLLRIERKNVIPVIGQGIYRIEIDSKGKKEYFLYDYLAEKLAESCQVTFKPNENNRFAKACLEFLKKNRNDYLALSYFLKEKLKGIRLVEDDSLCKLARIKSFNVFLNTSYDNFLVNTIKKVRNIPTEDIYYTWNDNDLERLNKEWLTVENNFLCTPVCHILGQLDNMMPAYTERDILETIVKLQQDMVVDNQNSLFMKLNQSSLLFIGCGFDNWLFRFFIRTITNEPYDIHKKNQNCNFVEDEFHNERKYPFQELPRFLRYYETEVFYSTEGMDFVDRLFKVVEKKFPREIIQPSDFSETAFISFEGRDRPAAIRLASHLSKDGFNVWLDDLKLQQFQPGDDLDKTIIKAIDKCPVFIPVISKNSEIFQKDKISIKYHIREWERAFTNKKSGNKHVEIIPVKIDNTNWIYKSFDGLPVFKITGGQRVGDYENLKNKLREIQRRT